MKNISMSHAMMSLLLAQKLLIGLDGSIQLVGVIPNERSQLDITLFEIVNPSILWPNIILMVFRGLPVAIQFII
jgi:hypothetical protein